MTHDFYLRQIFRISISADAHTAGAHTGRAHLRLACHSAGQRLSGILFLMFRAKADKDAKIFNAKTLRGKDAKNVTTDGTGFNRRERRERSADLTQRREGLEMDTDSLERGRLLSAEMLRGSDRPLVRDHSGYSKYIPHSDGDGNLLGFVVVEPAPLPKSPFVMAFVTFGFCLPVLCVMVWLIWRGLSASP